MNSGLSCAPNPTRTRRSSPSSAAAGVESERTAAPANSKAFMSVETVRPPVGCRGVSFVNIGRLDLLPADQVCNDQVGRFLGGHDHRIDDDLDEIEENLGKRYIDEDLNSKDNPYGLTEFDVEEVDELLNIEKNPKE